MKVAFFVTLFCWVPVLIDRLTAPDGVVSWGIALAALMLSAPLWVFVAGMCYVPRLKPRR